MLPGPAPADVPEDEPDLGVAAREAAQLGAVGRLLSRPVAPPVLPHMVQHRHAALARDFADRIEQRIGGPPARGQLDPDQPCVETPPDLAPGVRRVVRVDGDVAADAVRVLARQGEQGIVAVREVRGGRKVGRGRAAPAPQDGRHVDGDPDLVPRGEAAGVALAPVRAGGAVMIEVGVDIDEHA